VLEPLNLDADDLARAVTALNAALLKVYQGGPFHQHPVAYVRWVHVDHVRGNAYNPNAVALHEMRLLYVSIEQDGYTQPIVAIEDDDNPGRFVIVDGFHRYTIMRRYPDVAASTGGYLPLVIIDKPLADRIAATVRHNRARGKHSVAGMSSLVFEMLQAGESDETIMQKVGLEPEELARLKHITGYAKLHADHVYPRATLTDRQVRIKKDYHQDHPDEPIPIDI
jgi:ParB-like chromosome segregation protein Spo0J